VYLPAILGVEQDADSKEIKKAFRKLSLKYHPDKEVCVFVVSLKSSTNHKTHGMRR